MDTTCKLHCEQKHIMKLVLGGGTVGPLWWHCGTPVVATRVREIIDMRGCLCEKGCCVHVQETYLCHNHIRHFGVLNGRSPETLTLCGTFSFHRACTYVEVGEVCMLTSLCTVCATDDV